MVLKYALALFLSLGNLFLLSPTSKAEEKAAQSGAEPDSKNQSAGGLISANGFSCSTLAGKTLCQGKFEKVNKDLLIGAKGQGELTLQVKKGDVLHTYLSSNGCLCEEKKGEMSCKNAQGKEKKTKGEKMKEESAAFCKIK